MSAKQLIRIVIFLAFLLPTVLFAQVRLSDLEFFTEDDDDVVVEMLETRLESDWKVLRKSKNKPKYQAAQMTFYMDDDSATVNLKIKPRGEFRRMHCLFPPIWLNFKKADFENSSIKEFDKIKLVTHCRDQTSYKQQLIIEYYIYKMYEMLSDYSFKTKLIRINYSDTLNKRSPGWNYGILLEDEIQMSNRNNGTLIKSKSRHPESYDRMKTTVMDVFQFMIGNTDWSAIFQHNVKLMKINDPSIITPIPIPYDFDYCGLVDASYAVPPEELGLENVKERTYRGYCRNANEFQTVFDLFIEKKAEFIGMFENSELLDKTHKKETVDYLNQFYRIIENENLAERYLISQCK